MDVEVKPNPRESVFVILVKSLVTPPCVIIGPKDLSKVLWMNMVVKIDNKFIMPLND